MHDMLVMSSSAMESGEPGILRHAGQDTGSRRPFIVGIGGTTRPGSTSERALAVALRAADAMGARTQSFLASQLLFPHFQTQGASLPKDAEDLVEAVRRADGIVISSPGYHGGLSGTLKNALDYVEELRTDARPYFEGRAVGLIVCAGGWQATGSTLSSLRDITHALRGWPTPFGATINSIAPVFDENGECLDPAIRDQFERVGQQVVEFALMKSAFATSQQA